MKARQVHQRTAKGLASLFYSTRSGAVVVLVAVLLVVVLGFTVLAVDVGYMYDARAELQNAADAAALAGAAFLSSGTPLTAETEVRAKAATFAAINKAAGKTNVLNEQADVILGRTALDPVSNKYSFSPSSYPWDAVEVKVRRGTSTVSGPIGLFFAGFFGKNTANIGASATAVLVPRDIAMVVDLSGSMNDDSELGYYKTVPINLTQIWRDLGPGGVGPTWGNMIVWGVIDIDPKNYDPTTDPGLTYMPYGTSWSTLDVNRDGIDDFTQLPASYTAAMKNALKSGSHDSNRSGQYYADRVGVMLRLANWTDSNTNGIIDSGEIFWTVLYPYSQGSWSDWITNYVRSSSTVIYSANSNFRYRFGLKTFVNYLLETRESYAETSALAHSAEQPLYAVKKATQWCLQVIDNLDSNDQMSLEVYATDAHHEVNLTEEYHKVTDRLSQMQAGHYNSWTCIGGGLKTAIDELQSARARPHAKKMIMLMTDGNANVDQAGHAGYQYQSSAETYALDQANRAANLGIRIYTISVGASADRALMQQIASIGRGEEFFAQADNPSDYSAQLLEIFGRLGGKRPVALIK